MLKTKEKMVTVPAKEYQYLRKLKSSFEEAFLYFKHTKDIEEARHEAKTGRTVGQEKLFKSLEI